MPIPATDPAADPATGAAIVSLTWRVGDDWTSDEWAVLIDGAPVTLADPGWVVHGQARSRITGDVLAAWSSDTTDPAAGQVLVRAVQVPLTDGSFLTTSAVRLRHSAAVSQLWGAVTGEVEVEITRRDGPGGPITTNRTIVKGTVRAPGDVSQ